MKKYIALILSFLILAGCITVFAADEFIGDKAAWSITASSSPSAAYAIIDGSTGSYWHSVYKHEGSTGSAVVYWRETPPHRITITLPEVTSVGGFSYLPRQDMDLGRATKYTIYISSGNGTPVKVFEGEFDSLEGNRQNIVFDKSYQTKTFVFEINESVDGFGVIPELDLIKGSRGVVAEGEEMPPMPEKEGSENLAGNVLLDRTGITGEASSTPNVAATLDGDVNTYWHSRFTPNGEHDMPPFEIVYTMPSKMAISGIIMTPRQDRDIGRPAIYNIYAASEDNGEFEPVYQGTGNRSAEDLTARFSCNLNVKKLKIEYIDSVAGYGTLSEINFIAPVEGRATVDSKDYKEYSFYKVGNVKVKDNSGNEITQSVTDKSLLSYWRKDKSEGDYTITLELNSIYEVASIMVHPYRKYNFEGIWNKFDILASVDGKNYETVLSDGALSKVAKDQDIDFENPVKAKYFKIVVKETEGKAISMTEIAVYQNYTGYEHYIRENTEKYVLKVGENEFEAMRNGETYTVKTDAAPFIKYDITYIPLRALMEEMGAEIIWDDMTQGIYIEKNSLDGPVSIFMNIMDDRVYVTNEDVTTYETVRYTLIAPPLLVNGRTYIPLRFVSEHLGYEVTWEEETRTVTVSRTVE